MIWQLCSLSHVPQGQSDRCRRTDESPIQTPSAQEQSACHGRRSIACLIGDLERLEYRPEHPVPPTQPVLTPRLDRRL